MARRAAPSGAGATSARHQRSVEQSRRAQQRRLKEREQISGEIRKPAAVSSLRAQRSSPSAGSPSSDSSAKQPVSTRTLVPERTFSARLVVLGIVALVVISFMVPTVRTFVQQRAELNEVSAQIAEEQQRQEDLYQELNRWEDPQFVTQQARERLNLVMPGERRFHVLNGLEESTDSSEQDSAEETADWADDLWESVVDSAAE